MWWGVKDQNNLSNLYVPGFVDGLAVNLTPAQGFGMCRGLTYCEFNRTIIISNPGYYQIWANSRDILYPVPGEPHQASEGLGLAVINININPAFIAIPTTMLVNTGQIVSFDISAKDQNGDSLKIEMIKGVSGATFVPNTTIVDQEGTSSITGNFKWIPTIKQTGTYDVQFRVTDSQGGATISKNIQINVADNIRTPTEIN